MSASSERRHVTTVGGLRRSCAWDGERGRGGQSAERLDGGGARTGFIAAGASDWRVDASTCPTVDEAARVASATAASVSFSDAEDYVKSLIASHVNMNVSIVGMGTTWPQIEEYHGTELDFSLVSVALGFLALGAVTVEYPFCFDPK